jgi:hypothetical protein
MPSNVLRNLSSYLGDIPGVLATEAGMRSPRMLTIDLSYVQQSSPDPLNQQLAPTRILMPGSLISKVTGANYGRIFPASRSTVISLTTANTLTVKNAAIFKIGDVLRLGFAGATIGTITAINVSTNVITLAANAAVAVAVGNVINAVNGGDVINVYGMVLSAIDLNSNPNDIAAYTSCTVYGDRLPFWSSELALAFPEITFIVPVAVANFN